MTPFYRLPLVYAALSIALGLLSYPLLNSDINEIQAAASKGSTPVAPVVQVEVQTPTTQQQEKEKLVSFISQHYSRSPAMVSQIVEEATTHARAKGIDPLLFLAVISVESSFNPNAVSSAGAIGLSQVIPRFHPEKIQAVRKAGKSPTDIRENIRMGVDILAEYRKWHKGDMRLALLRYNGSLKDPRARYANKVMKAHAKLETIVDRQPIHGVSVVASP